jgi:hypothetical protein
MEERPDVARLEFPPAEEVTAVEEENERLFRLQLESQLILFRPEVLGLLDQHNAFDFDTKFGWAIFRVGSDSGDVLDVAPDREILISVIPSKEGDVFIKFITNELVMDKYGKTHFYGIDLSISGLGVLQYNIGCVEPVDQFMPVEGDIDEDRDDFSNQPIFYVNTDGKLVYYPRTIVFTDIGYVQSQEADGPHTVTPFGHYHNVEDNLKALEIAKDLLEEVRYVDPTHKLIIER